MPKIALISSIPEFLKQDIGQQVNLVKFWMAKRHHIL
jgi:hypothetical protein